MADPDVVTWEPGDQENPHSWSPTRRWVVTLVLNTLPLFVNIGSSILSGSSADMEKLYHVSLEVTILMTSVFLLVKSLSPLARGVLTDRASRLVRSCSAPCPSASGAKSPSPSA